MDERNIIKYTQYDGQVMQALYCTFFVKSSFSTAFC